MFFKSVPKCKILYKNEVVFLFMAFIGKLKARQPNFKP